MSTKTIEDQLLNYKTKYRAVLFGAISMILMALAITFYENSFSYFVLQMSDVLTFNGVIVKDSFILFIFFGILSVFMAAIGLGYSLINKKIIGFLLNLLIFAGILFVFIRSNVDVSKTISAFDIKNRTTLNQVIADTNQTDTNQTDVVISTKE